MTDLFSVAADNAATMWLKLGAARGYEPVHGDGFIAVSGADRQGRRIMTLAERSDLGAIRDLVHSAPGRVVVEDPFGTVPVADITDRLSVRQMPVMARHGKPALAAPSMPVRRASGSADLRTAERLITTGFALENFLPWRPGEAFPDALADDPAVAFFIAERDGDPAGACLTVTDDAATGFYWVTTMPEHRSRGVGRALMHGAIAELRPDVVTLVASIAGRPLYESMDFDLLGVSSWWS